MKKILLIAIIVIAAILFFTKDKSGAMVSQNGISTNQLADDILIKYDRNADGKLDVGQESFLRTERDAVIKVESRGLLFTDADDFGNKDGYVSKIELEKYLQKFDLNADGEITSYNNIFDSMFKRKSEWSEFENQYGEKFKYEEMEN